MLPEPTDSRRARFEELVRSLELFENVEPDKDGDFQVTTPEGNNLWVRLIIGPPFGVVRVFTILASGTSLSLDLLGELNAINAATHHVKVVWAGGVITAEVDVRAATVEPGQLVAALFHVRRVAKNYREVLTAVYGHAA